MLTIRLQRTGKRNQANFRIVLTEKEAPVQKKHLEVLGNYDPRKKGFKVNEDRVKYWVSQRVELSPTVHNLFVTKGLVEGAKVKAFSTPKKPAEAAAVPEVKPESSTPAPATNEAVQTSAAAGSEGSEKSEKSDQTTEAPKVE